MLDKFKKNWFVFLYIAWIVALKAVADYYDFKVPHHQGFWSLTSRFWDIWHLTENVSLLSVFIPLGFLMKLKKFGWISYITFMLGIMFFLHELILHGRIN